MRLLEGHRGPVRAVAYSPDGAVLASGGKDHSVQLWPLTESHRRRRQMGQHGDWVRGLAFAPDGKSLASAGWDDQVCLWGVERRSQLTRYPEHLGGAWAVAFSPAGDLMVSGAGNGTLAFFPRGEERPPPRRIAHRKPLSCVAFTPDGKYLLTGSHDGTVQMWNAPWQQYLDTVQQHEGWVYCVAASSDSQLIAAGDEEGRVIVSQVEDDRGAISIAAHVGPVAGLEFVPGGRGLLTVGWDGTARLWDAATGRERMAYDWGVGKLHCLAIAPDGMTAAAGAENGAVVMWDLEE